MKESHGIKISGSRCTVKKKRERDTTRNYSSASKLLTVRECCCARDREPSRCIQYIQQIKKKKPLRQELKA